MNLEQNIREILQDNFMFGPDSKLGDKAVSQLVRLLEHPPAKTPKAPTRYNASTGLVGNLYGVTVLPETVDEWLDFLVAEPTKENLVDAKAAIAELTNRKD